MSVNQVCVGKIGPGLLVLLGVASGDQKATADKMLHKLLNLRIFNDEQGKMNLSLLSANQSLLIVSQFTLLADTQKGLRPGFSKAADPSLAQSLYDYLVEQARQANVTVATGEFGANMSVDLSNDGPVTFIIEVE